MTATTAMIAQLRRMTEETTEDVYTDEMLRDLIEQHPIADTRGVEPYYIDATYDPPQQVAVFGWYPSYDLPRAAARVWREKAARHAADLDQPHEGRTYRYSQAYAQAIHMAKFWEARSTATSAVLIASPSPNRRGGILPFNAPELRD